MDDRSLVRRLLEIGVGARLRDARGYAKPSDDPTLQNIGVATIANWLEELGRHRIVGDVQPCFTSSGGGFKFQVTEEAVGLVSDASRFDVWLNTVVPHAPEFDVFISYATGDTAVATELRSDLEAKGLKCFMAEKDIQVATQWQDSIRTALIGSKRILVLLSPRSINRVRGCLWKLVPHGR
jgi:TIR domain